MEEKPLPFPIDIWANKDDPLRDTRQTSKTVRSSPMSTPNLLSARFMNDVSLFHRDIEQSQFEMEEDVTEKVPMTSVKSGPISRSSSSSDESWGHTAMESSYSEAPARLFSPLRLLSVPQELTTLGSDMVTGDASSATSRQQRRRASTDLNDAAFCSLGSSRDHIQETDLLNCIFKADDGLKGGIRPILAEGSMGGTYFLRDRSKAIQLVFKPSDEEPLAPNNPHSRGTWQPYKGRIIPGFSMYREVAAFALDAGFAGVPPTAIAKVMAKEDNNFSFTRINSDVSRTAYKLGSVQSYCRTECSSEDMGSSKFHKGDVQRLAVLDIRLCNLDRHAGNILVAASNPYQCSAQPSPRAPSLISDDPEKIGYGSAMDKEGVLGMCHEDDMWGIGVDLEGDIYTARQKQQSHYNKSSPPSTVAESAPALLDQARVPLRPIMTRGVGDDDVLKSPNPSSPSNFMRLVPIDHGYVLPHCLDMSEVNCTWLHYQQVAEPMIPSVRKYIEELDVEADCKLLHSLLGTAIPVTSLITLRACTYLLKEGVAAGLTLRDIGVLMCPTDDGIPGESPLQSAVVAAIQETLVTKSLGTPRVPFNSPVRCTDINAQGAGAATGASVAGACVRRSQERLPAAIWTTEAFGSPSGMRRAKTVTELAASSSPSPPLNVAFATTMGQPAALAVHRHATATLTEEHVVAAARISGGALSKNLAGKIKSLCAYSKCP